MDPQNFHPTGLESGIFSGTFQIILSLLVIFVGALVIYLIYKTNKQERIIAVMVNEMKNSMTPDDVSDIVRLHTNHIQAPLMKSMRNIVETRLNDFEDYLKNHPNNHNNAPYNNSASYNEDLPPPLEELKESAPLFQPVPEMKGTTFVPQRPTHTIQRESEQKISQSRSPHANNRSQLASLLESFQVGGMEGGGGSAGPFLSFLSTVSVPEHDELNGFSNGNAIGSIFRELFSGITGGGGGNNNNNNSNHSGARPEPTRVRMPALIVNNLPVVNENSVNPPMQSPLSSSIPTPTSISLLSHPQPIPPSNNSPNDYVVSSTNLSTLPSSSQTNTNT